MSQYVPSIEQLATEIFVRDIRRSTDFYSRLGFALLRDGGDFVELTWEDHRFFLAEVSALQGIQHVGAARSRDVSSRQHPCHGSERGRLLETS
jgi:catechol 2,3-dioxygenase-like lactoylglutathione lyase family enzyme